MSSTADRATNGAPDATAAELVAEVDARGIELIRFCFADQHGILRGKTITRAALPEALTDGVTAPSSLLLKDTSGRSVFPVFSPDPGVGVPGMVGAGDIVAVADPPTFRVLPWADRTGWVLCDLHFPGSGPVPLCTRGILRSALSALAEQGYALTVGVELEFHVFIADPGQVEPARPGQPAPPPAVHQTTPGAQLLHEEGLDRMEHLIAALSRVLTGLDLPLRSLELEFGPSQFEVTLSALDAAEAADSVLLLRTAIRQVCRRHGLRATFMSRPAGAETASTGWHLHQSLRDRHTAAPVFPSAGEQVLSDVGMRYLAGLLHHADAAAPFGTPTVNGYKRYQAYSLAPDRIAWGLDNKGAMIRVVGRPGDPAARLENRSGEPAANPYLYIAAQAISGLDGVASGLQPPPPTDDPYQVGATRLPATLGDALDALDRSELFRRTLSGPVVDWYLALKRSEYARYLSHVSDWEQREYLDLF